MWVIASLIKGDSHITGLKTVANSTRVISTVARRTLVCSYTLKTMSNFPAFALDTID